MQGSFNNGRITGKYIVKGQLQKKKKKKKKVHLWYEIALHIQY